MRTIAGTVALALVVTLGMGCRSSPLRDRFESVGKEISLAKAAGAPKYAPVDYEGAENALALAKDSESAAIWQREAAEGDRESAKRDLEMVRQIVADREAALDEAEKRKEGADAHLAQLLRRQDQLRQRGVTEKEVERALGDPIALGQVEASAARAQIKTIKAELDLLAVRRQEANGRIQSASDGIAVAGQQLLTASALCDTAAASARMAEAHAIAKRKAELEIR